MRSGPNTRRPMRRGNSGGGGGRRGGSPRSQSFDSNGPDIKVRGNAQQVVDKYQALAREASTAGDPVMAENYYQHAEHYYRVLHANGGGDNRQGQGQGQGARAPDNNGEGNNKNNSNGADENPLPNNGAEPDGAAVAVKTVDAAEQEMTDQKADTDPGPEAANVELRAKSTPVKAKVNPEPAKTEPVKSEPAKTEEESTEPAA